MVFTLQNPSVMPFLQYSDKRELREKMFNAYINRGNNNNENDNKEVVRDLVAARLAKAKLMAMMITLLSCWRIVWRKSSDKSINC